jgi:hypothetical protein
LLVIYVLPSTRTLVVGEKHDDLVYDLVYEDLVYDVPVTKVLSDRLLDYIPFGATLTL